jgi:hypothetical protein
VYPYAMKYLIIFSFGQNVSRMNTGDLTKLWRLNTSTYKSKHRIPGDYPGYYTDEELEYADRYIYPKLLAYKQEDSLNKTLELYKKSIECGGKKTFRMLIGTRKPFIVDSEKFRLSVDKFWNKYQGKIVNFKSNNSPNRQIYMLVDNKKFKIFTTPYNIDYNPDNQIITFMEPSDAIECKSVEDICE